MVSEGFIRWARIKAAGKTLCRVEGSLNCLPLEGDEICLGCYELEREVWREVNARRYAQKKKRKEHPDEQKH